MSARPAVFLDRDGTIIRDVNYLTSPEQLALLAGATDALRRLAEAGLPLIVVTNQSGIGRGLLTEADFARITARARRDARGSGRHADRHLPLPRRAPTFRLEASCRKPGDGMHQRAAREHDIDLSRSFYIGDKWRDVAPAVKHNAMGILVPTPETPFSELAKAKDDAVVATTLGAAVRPCACGGCTRAASLRSSTIDADPTPAPASPPSSRVAASTSSPCTTFQRDRGSLAAGEVVLVVLEQVDPAPRSRGRAERGIAHRGPRHAAAMVTPCSPCCREHRHGGAGAGRVPGAGTTTGRTRAFRGRILNVHPSLLPAFGGPGMYGRHVHTAVLRAGARISGATVHFVDEEYDRGAIIAQWPVPVFEEDSPETLAARVLRVEHALLPRVVELLCAESMALDDDGTVHGAFLDRRAGRRVTLVAR
ncbi:MAG: HAD-IIIA family hydrolase [Gemmatimonadaceae bacterium]|nr:HAD-IIIA family hydrolase [Gemmatimonadaceae bacterium]